MTVTDAEPRVGELMTRDPICIRRDATLQQAAELLEDYGVGGLPVIDTQGFLVGVITRTDLVRSRAESTSPAPWHTVVVGDLMSSPAITIRSGERVSIAAGLIANLRIHRLIVVGDDGLPIGVLSESDLVRELAGVCDESRSPSP